MSELDRSASATPLRAPHVARRVALRALVSPAPAALAWLAVLAASAPAAAQAAPAPVEASQSLYTLLAVGCLALVPLVFMTATSYAKIAVVFSILRNALGASEIPSGSVIVALSAILTLYVMAPVGSQMADAAAPAMARIESSRPAEDLDALGEAFSRGSAPLAAFLERNAGAREKGLFLDLARRARPEPMRASVTERDLLVLLPSFLVSELSEAFQIGFLVFLPFLVIDLVIANVLMSLGMQSLSPSQISVPFKLLLFVLVDGWYLLSRALVLGYV